MHARPSLLSAAASVVAVDAHVLCIVLSPLVWARNHLPALFVDCAVRAFFEVVLVLLFFNQRAFCYLGFCASKTII